MTYGAAFYNDAQTVQLDDQTPCMSLVARGTVAASSGTFYPRLTNGINPLMAIRPTNVSAAIQGVSKNGDTFDWQIATMGSPRMSGPNWSIDWYIFDKPNPTPSTSGWGLELYDAAGNVTYCSKQGPMNIAGVGHGTYSAGRTYAFHQNRMAVERGEEIYDLVETDDSRGNPNGGWEVKFMGYEKIPSGWEVIGNQIEQVHQNGGDYWIYPPSLLILDVTNL
ncbi:hypothetical protein KRZ98_18320 [Sphingobium sp. AS12]|uniref:hypothetical protein n=1 Tax=Sphingobium sp. AS12 TaxID=2849495 RepID=UPI001C31DD8C|nr:hypothetical protein [Sphingobium sp. AS12]MBV2150194.1 hypothetical protein [Sphingobium sp. AS12]